MHISLNNERILIIQTPLFSGKIEFLSDVKIFEKSLGFKNGLLYLPNSAADKNVDLLPYLRNTANKPLNA